jgi:small subunit ribosomal protein S6
MFILPSDLEEEVAAATTERVRSLVTSRGGEIRDMEVWGRRRLAYPINRRHDGIYHLGHFTLNPDLTVEIDRALRLNEQILRHLIIRKDD